MISVVIPLYNKASSIGGTLDSVLAQTYTDFEIIVVDDGSADGGADVVLSYDDARVRYVRKENGGVSSARNMGIELAKGEYVSFLDADDKWDPTYLEELVRLIEDCPEAGIYGLGLGLSVAGKPQDEKYGSGFRGYVRNPWTTNPWCWTGSSTTIRKEAFDKVGLFDERMAYGEDLDMWWRVALEYPGAYYEKTLAYYEQESENRAMTRFKPFEKHLPFYIEKYDAYRAADRDFRFFFDRECLYRIFQYTGMKQYKADLRRVLSKIDFSLQKKSMRLRFLFPGIYRIYLKLRGRV